MISMRYILLILFLFPICIVAVILQQQQRRQQQNQHHQKKRRFPFGRMTLEKRDSDRDLSAAASTTKATADTSNDESSSTTGSRSNHDIIDDEVIASMIEEIPEDAIFVHLIVLVHGWMGNALEMEILRKSLDAKTTAAISKMAAAAAEEEEIKATNSSKKHHHFMTYSTTVNEQRTHDGIAAGGTRVANEINQILRSIVSSEQRQDKENNSNISNNNKRKKQQQRNSSNNRRTVTLSFVGNSLGGLYSRYALGEIQFQLLDDDGRNNIVIPKLFITTATPHLGIKQNTFIKVPRLIERPIALAMKQTGLDLFSFSSTLHKMTIEPKFVDPLQKFEHRIAYANVHGTDFQVPTATAAFWEEKSNSEHFLCTFGEENEILATEDEEEAKAATAASYYCPMTTPRSRHRSSSSSALAAVNTATETTSSFSYDNDDQDDDDDDDDDGPHESIVAIYKTKSNPNIFDDVNKQKEKKKINDDDAVAEDVSLSKYLDAMGWTKVLVDVRPMLPSFSNNNSDDDGDSDDNNENDDPAKTTTTADAKTTAPTKPIKDVVEATTSDGSGGGGGTIGTTPTTESSSSSSVSLNTPRRRITSTTAKDLLKEYGGGQFLTIPLGHTVMVANAKNELYGWINQGGRPIMDSLASKMVDYLLLSSESSPSSSDNSKQ